MHAYSPTLPPAQRLAALRSLVDASRHRDVVVVMPPANGKSVAFFEWHQAVIRAKAPRGVHAEKIPAGVA